MYKVLLSLLLAGITSSHAQNFVTPLEGVPFQDWTIVNYLDLDASTGVSDWNGGNYSYNEHNAIDYTLPHFAAMDAGVSVYAAGNGTVIATHDGEFDRWSRVNPNPGDLPNYIVIDHGSDVVTEYLHLKKNSLIVNVGDNVLAGQKIAEVGSSGYSSDPHLHFAVFDNNTAIETYLNPSFWWQSPLAYAGDVDGVLDTGVTDHYPTISELVDKPAEVAEFDLQNGSGQLVVSWSNMHWNNTTDSLEYFFINPAGTVVNHYTYSPAQIRYGWWNVGMTLPSNAPTGIWTIRATVNSVIWLERNFTVIDGVQQCNGLPVTVDMNIGETTTAGNDVVMGTPGADDIRGKAGNDTICGMGGDDFIHGNSGNDWIDGGSGIDNIRGGRGFDTIYTGTGATVGTGSRAFGGYDDDLLYGGPGADDLRGGKGIDIIYGSGGNDEISGNDDDDELYGEQGDDFIKGGIGNDQLYGGADSDLLNGGSGASDSCNAGGDPGDTTVNCELP